MSKEKKLRTRKDKALRRGAVLLLLLAMMVVVGGYGLTPIQGIRYSEETAHTGRTSVVRDLGRLPLKGTGINRAFLCANDGGMLVALTRFYWLCGWLDYGFNSLDCSGDLPVHAGTYSISKHREGESNHLWYLYGRVDDPGAERLRVSLGYTGPQEEWVSLEELDLPKEEWFRAEGHTYFVKELPVEILEEERGAVGVRMTLLGSQGEVLYEERVENGGSTSLG